MTDVISGPPATSLEPARLSVLNTLRNHPRMKGIQIVRGQLAEGTAPNAEGADRLVNGYVCVLFSGRGRVRTGWQGITGTRNNLRSWVIGIEVYARDDVAKDRIADDVFDILEGLVPPNCSELENTYSGKISNPVSSMMAFSREGIGLLFDTTVDMGTVE